MCQVAVCDPKANKWTVKNDTSKCGETGECQTYTCDPSNENADDNGCVLHDAMAECKQEYPAGCYNHTCSDGKCVVANKCEQLNSKCWNGVCENGECEKKETEHNLVSNKCTLDFECNENDGWQPVEKDSVYCKEEYIKENPDFAKVAECYEFSCDPEKGCVHTKREGECTGSCSDDEIKECQEKHPSSDDTCVSTRCYYAGENDRRCEVKESKCETSGECQVAYCDKETNKCVVETVAPNLTADKCQSIKCDKETNTWYLAPTDVATSCVSDGCFDRHCDAVFGCMEVSKCVNNLCFTSVCNESLQCEYTEIPSPYESNDCQIAACYNSSGWNLTVLTDEQACPTEDKCVIATCNRTSGQCEYKNKTIDWNSAADKSKYNPCHNYTCNSTTGEFDDEGEKCVSELFCVKNECYDGECYQVEEECKNLDMTGYDCFYRSCTESRQCYRKLYAKAYIDICGRCLRNYDYLNPNQSLTQSEDEDCVDEMATPVLSTALTAAAIAGIVIAAIVGAVALAASGVLGTKELIKRASNAADQSAHSNPLFESNAQEMSNPAYMGDAQ